jgi:hypothetical protein
MEVPGGWLHSRAPNSYATAPARDHLSVRDAHASRVGWRPLSAAVAVARARPASVLEDRPERKREQT